MKTELILAILVTVVASGSIAMAEPVSFADSVEVDADTVFEGTVNAQEGSGAIYQGTMDVADLDERSMSLPGSFETLSANNAAYTFLAKVMDRYHSSFDVYSDADAAGNHFSYRGKMPGDAAFLPPMDESYPNAPHTGLTSIQCRFLSQGTNYGGWYFMNGVLEGSETFPKENWGTYPKAGFDLSGATTLTFWARGESGGERVEFFAFGVGRNPDTGQPVTPYPDSSPKRSTGFVTLSQSWTPYTIDLSGADLSYVLGGFGWVTNAPENGNTNIVFYLDDIKYDKPRLAEPRFLVSYLTESSSEDFDRVLRNPAFTYDNDLALLAFLAECDLERAQLIADGLVYAVHHDRDYPGLTLRNAYQGGDIRLFPGWTPHGCENTVRMPGWYDAQNDTWYEDYVQVSTHTGNVAWTMLALLAYYEEAGGEQYLDTAIELGEWVEYYTRDTRGNGGYTGGFEGWESNRSTLTYKSTEHNIDLYAAFQRLYLLTGEEKYHKRADHAKTFVASMWDETDGKFWTGTLPDGVTINTEVVPLDVQAWAILALKDDRDHYLRALAYAEQHHAIRHGFGFKEVNGDQDGVWYEGTAQMAAAYHETGQVARWENTVQNITIGQNARYGGIYATDVDRIWTGFNLTDGTRWLYYHRMHVGATAWYILAKDGMNPYWPSEKTKMPLTIVSPNGGEDWEQGSTQTIRWNYNCSHGPTVKIEALRGTTVFATIPVIPIGSGGSGTITVTVPYGTPPGSTYKIRVTSTSNPSFTDTSDLPFTVSAPTISLVTPNGGEAWTQGSPQKITWNYTGNPGSTITIEVIKGSTLLKTFTGIPLVPGSMSIPIPYYTPTGNDYRIRITSTSNPAWTDTSDDQFTISSAITVASPNGGENYAIGSTLPMSWTYSGDPGSTVTIEVFKGTSLLKTLTDIPIGEGGYGSQSVPIPLSTPPGNDYWIRVTSTRYPGCIDASNSHFTISAPG